MCRQLWGFFFSLFFLLDLFGYSIREFTSPSFPVYMYDGEGNHKVMTREEVSFFSLVSFLSAYICSICLLDHLLMNPVAARLFRPRPS